MRFSTTFRRWYRDEVILQVGSLAITRERLVRDFRCSNFRAATLLHGALAALKVGSLAGLARITPDDLVAIPGIGERSVFVATCLIHHAGADVLAWLNSDHHRHTGAEPLAIPLSRRVSSTRRRAA